MKKLSDFMPIDRLVLPNIGAIDCSGLVLVVGPNSSGKSQLLRDIYFRLVGEPRVSVVAREILLKKPNYEELVECFKGEGIFESVFTDDGSERIRPRTTYGTGEAAPEAQPHQVQQWHNAYTDDEQIAKKRRSEFLNYFGKFLVTQLFLERRLTSLNAVGLIDFINSSPQHDIHALYLNTSARALLMDETKRSFSKAIWPDSSRGSQMCMRVCGRESYPSAEDRLDPYKMVAFRQIESEGDGFKSYAATCVSLLLSRRPVCLIDEPELCLHPPQAYNLGGFIGRVAEKNEGVTFVSTHSSHVLRGVIQGAGTLQIVRLTRKGEEFEAHLVPSEVLKESLKKPTVRAESILDGIFSQAVVIVESDTDRTVYQAVWESMSSEFNSEVHFSAVGGIGGIADSATLYKTLRIPVAVVADLDILTEVEAVGAILRSLASEEEVAPLLQEIETIANEIRLIPPIFSPSEASNEILDILAMPSDWSAGDDVKIRRRLVSLNSNLSRMLRLKNGGVSAMPAELASRVETLLGALKSLGLFLVPVGELEGWLKGRGIQVSRKKKWAWANEAAAVVRGAGSETEDVWSFMRGIGVYLFQSESTTLTSPH